MDRRRDLAKAFVDGREVATFGSAAELREQILRWMADPQGRQRVAEAGQRRVKAEHTYEHRLAAACKALGLGAALPGPGAAIPH
jgi:spore maturation protein CgeB